jgi:hypothetical protein
MVTRNRTRVRPAFGSALVAAAILSIGACDVGEPDPEAGDDLDNIYYEVFNYVQSASFVDVQRGYTPGQAPRAWNRVWRPAGNNFYLSYTDGNGSVWGVQNAGSNPFTMGPYGYGYAVCQNIAQHPVYPVTCQTTR